MGQFILLEAFQEEKECYAIYKRRNEIRKTKRMLMTIGVSCAFSVIISILLLILCFNMQDVRDTECVTLTPHPIEHVHTPDLLLQKYNTGLAMSIEHSVISDISSLDGVSYVIEFTDDERWMFEHVIAAESYPFWKYDDILSLATVVMNRVQNDEQFPDTLWDVLTQNNQFETYQNGRYLEAVVTDECREAVEHALRGEVNLNSDVLWFCTKDYYESADENDFFSGLRHVYTCRNVYFFEE